MSLVSLISVISLVFKIGHLLQILYELVSPVVGDGANFAEPPPHGDPVDQRVEPNGGLGPGMIEGSVAGANMAARARRVVVGHEQGLGEIEQGVGGVGVAEIDETAEAEAVPPRRREKIANMEVIVREDRAAALR